MRGVWRLEAICRDNIPTGIVKLTKYTDIELLSLYATIALYEYERAGYKHGNPLDQLFGTYGELAFRECLMKLNIHPKYLPRKLNYWVKDGDSRPYDFKLKDGREIEIVTVKPNHQFSVLKDTKFKRELVEKASETDYLVTVQIQRFECLTEIYWNGEYQWFIIDAKSDKPIPITDKAELEYMQERYPKPVGKANVGWYATFKQVKDWEYSEPRKPPTTEAPGWIKELDQLDPIKGFWEILKPSLKTKRRELGGLGAFLEDFTGETDAIR